MEPQHFVRQQSARYCRPVNTLLPAFTFLREVAEAFSKSVAADQYQPASLHLEKNRLQCRIGRRVGSLSGFFCLIIAIADLVAEITQHGRLLAKSRAHTPP